jgi:serine/threonine protein kinase
VAGYLRAVVQNVLLDANGRCKIADFGVAHYFEEESKRPTEDLGAIYRSQSRGLLKNTDGTWCFWAPEMCK